MFGHLLMFMALIQFGQSMPGYPEPMNVVRVPGSRSPEYLHNDFRGDISLDVFREFKRRFGIMSPIVFPYPQSDGHGNRNDYAAVEFPVPPGQLPRYYALDPLTNERREGFIFLPVPREQGALRKGQFPLYFPSPRFDPITGAMNAIYAPYVDKITGKLRYVPFQVSDPNTAVFPSQINSVF